MTSMAVKTGPVSGDMRPARTMRMRALQGNVAAAVLALCAVLTASGAPAEERILRCQSNVTINRDSSLLVTETITMRSEKATLGISKDFPAVYSEQSGPALKVQKVTIDGKEGDYLAARLDDNRQRIIIQTENETEIPPGIHIYTLTYITDRHFSYFQDQDVLTWNATASGWSYPIEEVLVIVMLPSGIREDKITVNAFAGAGDPGEKSVTIRKGPGSIQVASDKPLAPQEAFALVLSLPKGAVKKPVSSAASEAITGYHSRIVVHEDAAMTVTESITVTSRHEKIKHGIYRDFPTDYTVSYGAWLPPMKRKAGFDVLETTRDGKKEPFHVRSEANGVRVYLGSEDVVIPEGRHAYAITYRTDRQAGFFPDHDELYWNVTGNGWQFPIEKASATVVLPPGIPQSSITLNGYTGPEGSKDQDYRAWFDEEGNANFATMNPLGEYEGLTVVVSFPKGVVREPTQWMKFAYFFRDNPLAVLAGSAFVLTLLYYFVVWFVVGRDPRRGAIRPVSAPPDGLSPAAMRYLARMGFDDKTFAAVVINLAVQGRVSIKEEKGVYTLTRIEKPKLGTALAPEEQQVYEALPPKLALERENYTRISSLLSGLEASLQSRYEQHFRTNDRYTTPGMIMSLFALIFAGIIEDGNTWPAATTALFLAGCLALLFYAVITARRIVKGTNRVSAIAAVIVCAVLAGGAGVLVYNLVMLVREYGFPSLFITALALLIPLNILFRRLLKARSPLGRRIMDEIEGFRLFLASNRQDRSDHPDALQGAPELFERHLAYALAFDLENQWAERFSSCVPLHNPPDGGSRRQFSWYSDRSRDPFDMLSATRIAATLGSSLSSAVSSSSTAPGSSSGSGSSGGGSGSSGGGGGGGGGGGW